MTRDVVIDTIQRGIMAMARRARTTAADLHPALTLVDFSMLDLLDERDGCRAVDLAAYFQLDKSTVSRQVAGLSQAGLIHVAPGAGGRGQLWRLTKAGREALAGARRLPARGHVGQVRRLVRPGRRAVRRLHPSIQRRRRRLVQDFLTCCQ
nr:hypothetical protein GCM10020092_035570 [Actinoplanes digitatis]